MDSRTPVNFTDLNCSITSNDYSNTRWVVMSMVCIEATPLLQVVLTFGVAGILLFCYCIIDILRRYYLKWKKNGSQ